MTPEDLSNVQLVAEVTRRRLLVDGIALEDVPPEDLAAAVLASPEARRVYGTLLVRRRKDKGANGQKPVDVGIKAKIREMRAEGLTQKQVAKKLKVSMRSVARYQG
jgi:DNA-binding NarL/FixJ family response regulator